MARLNPDQPVVRVTADGGRVDDSRQHTVVLRADRSRASLQLDDGRRRSFTVASPAASPALGATTSSSVHLGSLGDSSAPSAAVARRYLSPSGFVGCIQVYVKWLLQLRFDFVLLAA